MDHHPEAGGLATIGTTPAYLVVIEWAETNYSASVPDLPGCVATGETVEEVTRLMREGIALHLERMRADGEPIPPPTTTAVLIAAPAARGARNAAE